MAEQYTEEPKDNTAIETAKNNVDLDPGISVLAIRTSSAQSQGEWIRFPMTDIALNETIERISNQGEFGIMILDTDISEEYDFLKTSIDAFTSLRQINLVAKLVNDKPHPAVQAFSDGCGALTMMEIANLLLQEDDIPFYGYEYDGMDDPNVRKSLNEYQKMGYTALESNRDLMTVLEDLKINNTSLLSFLDVEAVGKSYESSGYVVLSEHGYIDRTSEMPDLLKYNGLQVRKEAERMYTAALEKEELMKGQKESLSVTQGIPEEADREEVLSKEREEELESGYGEGFLDVEYATEYLAGEQEEIPDGSHPSREKEALVEDGSRTEIGNPTNEAKEPETEDSDPAAQVRRPSLSV